MIPCSLHIYDHELGQCGFSWRARSVRDDASVSNTHLSTFEYRTLLVEVIFNVRLPIVYTCGRLNRSLLVGTDHVYGAMVSPFRPLVLSILVD